MGGRANEARSGWVREPDCQREGEGMTAREREGGREGGWLGGRSVVGWWGRGGLVKILA